MSEVLLLVRVTVNDAQVAKTNAKRARLGKQSRTGVDEVINRIGEALQHNLMFEQPVEILDHSHALARHTDVITALKNVGIDTECGACMEIGFTGVTTNLHTCASPGNAVVVVDDGICHGFRGASLDGEGCLLLKGHDGECRPYHKAPPAHGGSKTCGRRKDFDKTGKGCIRPEGHDGDCHLSVVYTGGDF